MLTKESTIEAEKIQQVHGEERSYGSPPPLSLHQQTIPKSVKISVAVGQDSETGEARMMKK